jgi:hypothetical protein
MNSERKAISDLEAGKERKKSQHGKVLASICLPIIRNLGAGE